jgi:hypothetical protein
VGGRFGGDVNWCLVIHVVGFVLSGIPLVDQTPANCQPQSSSSMSSRSGLAGNILRSVTTSQPLCKREPTAAKWCVRCSGADSTQLQQASCLGNDTRWRCDVDISCLTPTWVGAAWRTGTAWHLLQQAAASVFRSSPALTSLYRVHSQGHHHLKFGGTAKI